jgi:predicted ATPase
MELMGDERGGVLIVEGPAGIGKTRLLHEVLQRARTRGYGVGYGSARAKEGRFPYAPLIDALRMLLRDDPTAAEHLPAELGIAMRDVAVGPPAGSADRLASRSALFAAVLRFLSVRAGRTPLVLVLDDLHVADEGTLRALAYLGRRVDSHPIMLIASW